MYGAVQPVRGFTRHRDRRGVAHTARAAAVLCGLAATARAQSPAPSTVPILAAPKPGAAVKPKPAVIAPKFVAPPPVRPVSPAPLAILLEGHVLAIEEGDLIVDLASKDGVSVGDDLELWRPLKLVHPVTRRAVTDRYRIGSLKLTQVRPTIALGRVEGTPLRQPAAGDVVIVERAPPASPSGAAFLAPSAAPASEAEAGQEPLPLLGAGTGDPEARAVTVIFESLRGASLTTRIRKYEHYAHGHPNSRFSRVFIEEAAALRELVAVREHETSDAPSALHFDAPGATIDETPLTLAIEVGGRAVGAVLQARNSGEVAYRPTPMAPAGQGYFTATVPADRVASPRLEYFIEATRDSGQAVPIAGNPDAPLKMTVHEVPHAAPPLKHENTVTVSTDYADYNRLKGNDRVWQTEGTFAMRFDDIGVRALRSGFGVYRGVGGSVRELDMDPPRTARRVGLTYGHLEGEFGIKPTLSVIVRAVLGLGDDGTSGGAQLHLRIGSDKSTNIRLGGEVLGGIGLRGITQLELEPRGRFPIVIRSEVTNQPAGSGVSSGAALSPCPAAPAPCQSTGPGDIGVRGIVQVGYRIVDPLVIAVRGSYGGRTIDHAGPGVGGALEYRW
jgi:hypothetical protein